MAKNREPEETSSTDTDSTEEDEDYDSSSQEIGTQPGPPKSVKKPKAPVPEPEHEEPNTVKWRSTIKRPVEEKKGTDLKVSKKKIEPLSEKETGKNLKKNEEAPPVSTPRSEKPSPLKTKKKPVPSSAGTARHEKEPRRKIPRTEEAPHSEDTNTNKINNKVRERHLDDDDEDEMETRISQKDGAQPPHAEEPKTDKLKISRGLSGRKRPREDEKEEMETKISIKKDSKGETEPRTAKKKQLIQRIWSDDDEIVLLKGMVDFKSEKKSDPYVEIDNFLDFIKDKIHVKVTKPQLQNKMKRLKNKYENNRNKERNGKEANFLKPHERESYRLSKAAWRVEAGNENGKIDSGARELLAMRRHLIRSDDKVFGVGDNCLMERSRSAEEEKEWKNLLIAELEAFLVYEKSKDARANHLLRALNSDDIH